ncbi:gluconokinase [Puniceicoccus vermicola]|uniref:Gluconokinase n=1 Tax=Puniceicoccus vermicola TaxID=388746 RepID=A0A7X1B1B4_9BACT|nr:gluconokinase [Puniceicoccus vermicola]MBC2602713.1 gluconokinase [Puniceicoccus vermicola]
MQKVSLPTLFLVMGVSGCGKTTVGQKLAEELHIPFLDADDFHGEANRAKMANGIPLTDEDRIPWMQRIHEEVRRHFAAGESVVLACSALRESYRSILCAGTNCIIIWLDPREEILARRLAERTGHFMPASLLASQLETLEAPKNAIRIRGDLEIDEILREIKSHISPTPEDQPPSSSDPAN